MRDFLKLLTKEELIEAIIEQNFRVDKWKAYSLVHKRLTVRHKNFGKKEWDFTKVRDREQERKEFNQIQKDFDKLEKIYEEVSQKKDVKC